MNPFAAVYRYVSGHPIGFWFIFWGELAERCSYYGMRAILLLYMINRLGFSEVDGEASKIMHYFMASCYFLPLLGGWIADNYLGKYWTIVGFSLPYILGHFVLGIENRTCLFIALGLLAMGTGVIKPNISTLMGLTYDQRRPGNEQLRSDAFSIFYAAINIGSAISTTLLPSVRDAYGYQIAFLVPAALMVVAFFFFTIGKRFYAVETIRPRVSFALFKSLWSMLQLIFSTVNGNAEGARRSALELTRVAPEWRLQLDVLYRLSGVLLIVTAFWMIFDQHASTWTLFAKDHLDLEVRIGSFSKTLAPDQIQSLNPWFIIALLPVMAIVWRMLPKFGIHLKPTSKMAIGFVLTGSCMALMCLAAYRAGEGRVSVAWQIAAYLLITVAEICISVVGLELSFSVAPRTMKSFVSACWLMPVGIANLLNAKITPLYAHMGPTQFFGVLALVLVPVTIVFLIVAAWFNRAAATWQYVDPQAPLDVPPASMEVEGQAIEAAG
ncbi:MAG: peptide MFS transporter [Pirellulales bacterium]